jgi:hypothetical protein
LADFFSQNFALEEEKEFSAEDVTEVWDWNRESDSRGGGLAASLAASINLKQGFTHIRQGFQKREIPGH